MMRMLLTMAILASLDLVAEGVGEREAEPEMKRALPVLQVAKERDDDVYTDDDDYDDLKRDRNYDYRSVMSPPYRKPPICHYSRPCCVPGELKLILGSKGYRAKKSAMGKLDYVSVGKFGPRKRQPCSQSALVVVDFQKIDNDTCFGCLEGPYCGRRMLKVELELSNAGRGGYLFNVGDSQSNDGHRGDYGHQRNDAEIMGRWPHVTVYPSDNCYQQSPLMHIVNSIHNNVRKITLYISNEHVRITNSEGLDYRLCTDCLYALNGQPDYGPIGGPNERIFIALNRVVNGRPDRTGFGVCSATFSWMCPWCE